MSGGVQAGCYGSGPGRDGRSPGRGEATILAAIAGQDENADAGTETELTPEATAELIAAGAQLIDVRQDYEWDAGHIEEASQIPLEQLPGRAEELDRDRPVVFQCRSGSRSSFATSAFREAGYEAFNLAGGLQAWVDAGMPIVPADGVVADPLPDGR